MELEKFPQFIEDLRCEVRKLRTYSSVLKRAHSCQLGINSEQREEIKRLKQEKRDLKKKIDRLEKEIEKYSKTMTRYQVALFDHGNYQSPASDTNQEQKKKGGQIGHADTNRERLENQNYENLEKKHIFACSCPKCGKKLSRVNSTSQKLLLDIVLNPKIVQLIIESERQWCGQCKKEIKASDDRSLPFTEFGINTLMMTLLLRYRCLLPLSKITMVLKIGYGLDISQSGISSLLRQAKKYLNKRYQELTQMIRNGEIMYTDETGWRVRNRSAWMWIMANDKATVYVAAESRGKGIAQKMYGNSKAYSMHDGYGAYTNTIPKDKQMYCWAHLLRFCYEETINQSPDSESVSIRDKLVEIYHLSKNPNYQINHQYLEQEVTNRINQLLENKTDDITVLNILHRLNNQKDGLIRALIVSPNGTNNFAEQELRPIALSRKISYGSNTFGGMETTAVLASVIQTYARTEPNTFFPSLALSIRQGFGRP